MYSKRVGVRNQRCAVQSMGDGDKVYPLPTCGEATPPLSHKLAYYDFHVLHCDSIHSRRPTSNSRLNSVIFWT